MNYFDAQTPIDISGTVFPTIKGEEGKSAERFWYAKDEFIKHSQTLLSDGQMFSKIIAHRVNDRWVCEDKPISSADTALFVGKMRLFYMKSESMSIHSLSNYMEKNIANIKVKLFFRYMRETWEESLRRPPTIIGNYAGTINSNKQLIDTVLYSGNFHSQERYKRRYDELLAYMDESLILKFTYNAMHSGFQMNQISRALSKLSEDSPVVLLPNHLQHVWDENCPYEVG